MTRLIALVTFGFFAAVAHAEDTQSEAPEPVFLTENAVDLSEFVWTKRPIVVFADSENDPNFRQQMEFLQAQEAELRERDVVVMTDTTPGTIGPLREKLRPRGFMLVLIGKDGAVKLRKPFPWDVREISRSIDKMPMRQREIRERKADG